MEAEPDLSDLLSRVDVETLQAIAYALGSEMKVQQPHDIQPLVEAKLSEEMYDELLGVSSSLRTQRVNEWIDKTVRRLPYLLPRPSNGISYLRTHMKQMPEISVEQAFWYKWLLAHAGSTGYAELPNNGKSFEFPQDYGPHYLQREEMWNLCGFLYSEVWGEFYLSCQIWRKQERPMENEDFSSSLLKMHMFLLFPDGRSFAMDPVCLPVSMPIVHIQNSPFRVLLGDQRLDATYESTLFPMNVEWVDPASRFEIRLQLEKRKSSWNWAHVDHGVGIRKYAYPHIAAEGSLVLEGAGPHPVHGQIQYHHMWEFGTFPATYPKGFLMHALRVVQGGKRRDKEYFVPMQLFGFLNNTIQFYGYMLDAPRSEKAYNQCKSSKGMQLDIFTLHMEDGEMQKKAVFVELSDWVPVDNTEESYPQSIRVRFDVYGIDLHSNDSVCIRRNLMYTEDPHARWDDVWLAGGLHGTWKKQAMNGQLLVSFGTHQSTRVRVSSILSLMKMTPDQTKAPSMEKLTSSLCPTGPSTTQKTACIFFWLVPVVLFAVVIFMLVIMFRTSGVLEKKQTV